MAISRRQAGAFAFLAFGLATVPASAETNDQAAVAEAVAALTKAMLGADRAKLESLVSDNLSYGHSAGAIQDILGDARLAGHMRDEGRRWALRFDATALAAPLLDLYHSVIH